MKKLALLTVCIFSAILSPLNAEEHKISINWLDGYRYLYKIEFEKDLSIRDEAGSRVMHQIERDQQSLSFLVRHKDAGVIHLIMRYHDFTGQVFRGPQKVDDYSIQDFPNGLGSLLLERELTYEIGSDGLLKGILGTDDLIAELKSKLPAQLHPIVDSMYSPEALSERYRQVFEKSVPSELVTLEQSWNHRSEIDQGQMGIMQSEISYTLSEVSENAAKIAMTVAVKPKGDQISVLDINMEFIDSSGSGTIRINRKDGVLVENSTSQNFKSRMKVPDNGKILTMFNETVSKQSMTLVSFEEIQ